MLDFTGLLEPQKAHSLKLLNSLYLNGVASDLSETGIGKTFVASWVAKQFNSPVVVICPKSVIRKWKETLAQFGVKANLIINFEKLMRGGTPYVKFREATNKNDEKWRYQLVQANFPAGSLIILDEAHKCKGTTSLNAGLMIALKRQGYKVLTLSATQATNPVDMRAYGYATNLHDLYKFKSWCIDNGAVEVGRWGALTFNTDDESAKKKMKGCHENLFNLQHIASRLTRKQMGALFPDNQIVAEAYDLGTNNPKIQAVYDEMEQEIAKLEEGSEDYSQHVFAQMVKARRRAEMLKIPLFQEMFEDLYDEGKSVVVFLNYTESIVALTERLRSNDHLANKIGLIYGGQSDKARYNDWKAFQSDKLRGLICNLKAGGVALDFHDLNGNFPRASLLSPSFSAIDILQALGRVHRQGGKTPCYQRLVYASNCIEEHACNRVQTRCNNISYLVDGDLTAGFKLMR